MPAGDRQFGARLRRLRQARNLTQKHLAGSRYSDAYISALEAGRRHPSGEVVTYLAGRLGIEPEELLTGRPTGLPVRLALDIKLARKEMSAGKIDDAKLRLATATDQAKRFRLLATEAAACESLGRCAVLEGSPERGLECYDRALALLAGEPMTARVEALAGKARCLRMLGDLHYAVYLLEQGLEGLRREELREAEALLRLHSSLVPAYFQLGAYRKAWASAQEALRFAPHSEEPERVADMHINVARVMLARGRTTDALQSLARASELFTQVDLQTEIGHCSLALGFAFSHQGKFAQAREHLARAEKIFVATRSGLDEARVKTELGRIARCLGDIPLARQVLGAGIALLRDQGDVPELALAMRELGLAEASAEPADPVGAEKHFRGAIALYERIGSAVDLAITYRCLGDALRAQDHFVDAADAYRAGLLAIEAGEQALAWDAGQGAGGHDREE